MDLYSSKKTKEIYLSNSNQHFTNVTANVNGILNEAQVNNLLNEEPILSELVENNNYILELISKFELTLSINE